MNQFIQFKKDVPFKYYKILALIYFVIYLFAIIFLNNNYNHVEVEDILEILINFTAAFSLFYAAYYSKIYGKHIYYAWLLLAIAQLFYAAGDVVWAVMEVSLNISPFPSVADDLYLLYYVLFAVGLILLSRPINNRENLHKTILDMSIIIISAILIFWTTLFSLNTNNLLPLSLSLYYVIRDFVLFFLILNLIFKYKTKEARTPFILLLGGVAAYIVTDSAFGFTFLNEIYASNDFIAIGWVISFILIGLAGISQGKTAKRKFETLEMPGESSKPILASIIPLLWISVAVFMLVWSFYNLPPANFANSEIKFVIFILLVFIRYLLHIIRKKGYLR